MIIASGARGPGFNSRLSRFNTSLLLNHWNSTGRAESYTCWRKLKLGKSRLRGNNDAPKDIIIGRRKIYWKRKMKHTENRCGVWSTMVLEWASRSKPDKSREQFPSSPDLTLLNVELLIIYRVRQNLLPHKTYTRTIQTARHYSNGRGKFHGNKGVSK